MSFGIFRALGELLLVSRPQERDIAELMKNFDEFRLVGLNAIKPGLRPHLAKHASMRSNRRSSG